MFRRLVSNVSFSPALVGQLGFYARRLRQEEATRRLGLIFTILALVVQSFVVFIPPEAALAASSNDFIYGGVTSKSNLLSNYDANTNNFKDVMNRLGITRAELTNLTENQYINSASSNPTYYSWGHNSKFSSAQGERYYNVPVAGGGTSIDAYARPLSLWGSYSPKVMTGYSAAVGWFAIMYDCGNLVTVNYPQVKVCPSNTTGVYPDCKAIQCPTGTTGTYPDCKTPVCPTGTTGTYPDCKSPTCPTGTTGTYPDCKTPVCPTGMVGTYPDCKTPVCPTGTTGTYPDCKSPTCPTGTTGTYPDCKTPVCPTGMVGTYPDCKKPVCHYNSELLADDKDCVPCPGDSSLWIKDDTCAADLIPSKTATNISQGNVDATTAVAKAGDRIQYQISIKNEGKDTASSAFDENLIDVMEYASLSSNGGGTYDETTKKLTWPAVDIKPGETQTRIFSVQLSSSIPVLNRGTSDRDSYDCKMLNTFGNSLTINVDCPAPKQIEQVVSVLPKTGIGENVLAAGGVFGIVAYFYARSRQLKKEVRLIRRDINTGTI